MDVGQHVKGVRGHLDDHGGVVELVLQPEDTFIGGVEGEGDMVSELEE